jgi:hypothetical protein
VGVKEMQVVRSLRSWRIVRHRPRTRSTETNSYQKE